MIVAQYSITGCRVINCMHGGSPIVEVVRDRYELMETEITVLFGREMVRSEYG